MASANGLGRPQPGDSELGVLGYPPEAACVTSTPDPKGGSAGTEAQRTEGRGLRRDLRADGARCW